VSRRVRHVRARPAISIKQSVRLGYSPRGRS